MTASKKFSSKKPINQKSLEKVPGDKPGVYRVLNSRGDVLYVGMAQGGRLPDRIMEHKGAFKGGTQFQYRATNTKEEAKKVEKKEIENWKPRSNDLLK